jgi:hypothetical protein
MIELCDTVVVEAAPEVVWQWLESLPDHYRAWHPDHAAARWVEGHGFEPHAVLEAHEVLHGRMHRLRMTLTEVEPVHLVRYTVWPGVTGELRVEPVGSGTAFTACIALGTRAPVLGPALDLVLTRVLRGHIEALRQHQQEEGVRLKALLEHGTPS